MTSPNDHPYLFEVHSKLLQLWGFTHCRTDWLHRELRLLRDCIEDERILAFKEGRVERECTPGFMAIATLCVLRDCHDNALPFMAGKLDVAEYTNGIDVEPELPFVDSFPARLIFFIRHLSGVERRLVIEFGHSSSIDPSVKAQHLRSGVPLLHVHVPELSSLSLFSLVVSDLVSI